MAIKLAVSYRPFPALVSSAFSFLVPLYLAQLVCRNFNPLEGLGNLVWKLWHLCCQSGNELEQGSGDVLNKRYPAVHAAFASPRYTYHCTRASFPGKNGSQEAEVYQALIPEQRLRSSKPR